MLLLEQVDRLTRLTEGDWQRLLGELKSREIRVVSIDLPTSWMMATSSADEFTNRMFAAVNGMLLEVLAATARKDYEDRRRRQAQGIVKAKDAGKFKGRAENVERNAGIAAMLRKGVSWNEIQAATGQPCNDRQGRQSDKNGCVMRRCAASRRQSRTGSSK